MAKLTLTDVSSGYASTTAVNANNALIEEEFENTLSRDGTGPNYMQANFDMNGYLILNQGNPISISGFTWEGPWVSGTGYQIGDVVENSGAAYIAIIAHTSAGLFSDDSANWQTLASGNLPTQAGNATKFLQTDGTTASWEVPDAVEVSFTPSGTGAVATTLQAKHREVMSAKDFGATGDGSTDDTTAMQAAITAAAAADKVLFIPTGTYKITDTLNIPNQTQIVGEHQTMGFLGGTIIDFQPASAKSLFVPSGLPATLKDGYLIEGLYLKGNAANSTGNSIYAIDVDNITKSVFRNIRIAGFRTGIRCEATINNRFEFVMISTCYIQCVLYDGGFATTDVWEQCYISNAPIGVQTSGASLGIRWKNCIFETLDTYGVNLVKEVYSWSFTDCYTEDVPSANVATNAMFRVGYDGTTLPTTPQLTISGGYYGGRNAGGIGSLLDVDYTDGVTLGGFIAARYTNVVKTTANTQTNQIVANSWTALAVSSMVTDATKVTGFYPIGAVNSGTRNAQTMNMTTAAIDNLTAVTQVDAGRLLLNTTAIAVGAGVVSHGNTVATTVGGAGGASALPATPLGYLVSYIGTQQIKIPYYLP